MDPNDVKTVELWVFDVLEYLGKDNSLAAAAVQFKHYGKERALKERIENLERHFNLKILTTGGGNKKSSLTKAGKKFVTETKDLLDRMYRNTRYISPSHSRGLIRLCASDTLANDILLEVARRWEQQFPDIDFHITIANAKDALDALKEGHADLSLILGKEEHWDGMIWPLWKTACPMVAVVGHDHELYERRSSITAKELTQYNLALPPDDFLTRGYFDSLLANEGEPKSTPRFQANSIAYLKNFLLPRKLDPPIQVPDRRIAVLPYFAVWKEVQSKELWLMKIKGADSLHTAFCLGVESSRWHSTERPMSLTDAAESLKTAFQKFENLAKPR